MVERGMAGLAMHGTTGLHCDCWLVEGRDACLLALEIRNVGPNCECWFVEEGIAGPIIRGT
jgi:hypothetical protein